MLTVIGTLRSRTIRVLWALEEFDLKYEIMDAAPRSDLARKYHPTGKIPALVVTNEEGETVLTDSVAIVQYLADREGRMTAPAGTLARGRQDGFTQFVCDEVDGALWQAAKHKFVLPEDQRIAGVQETARAEFDKAMDVLAERLGAGPYLMGEEFTVPDLILGHCAGWAKMSRFRIPDGALGAYFERVRGRSALARAVEAGTRALRG